MKTAKKSAILAALCSVNTTLNPRAKDKLECFTKVLESYGYTVCQKPQKGEVIQIQV